MNVHHLLISCPDKYGIVANVSQFIYKHHGFILDADQHSDTETNHFFMRYVLDLTKLNITIEDFTLQLQEFCNKNDMQYQLINKSTPPRIVILASKESHCLEDILYRCSIGELPCQVVGVISNHDLLERRTKWYDIPFYHVPVEDDKSLHFNKVDKILDDIIPDTIVLGRYMQILPKKMCDKYLGKMINIHHSFLPSFVGASPYTQAYQRGVKLIGATAHYVTADLDAGPIIEQDVTRISHRLTINDYKRLGRDVERMVLAKALRAHLADRVMVHGNRTIIL